ncbi:phage tail P2-like protein [Chromohalobacter marismortui]|uniref:Phage tail P2-like protein n=1 Tax=Chromohalobacter marismortui TaxID=42055 RepID=A0A4R7NRP4_9GAMM|nr:MULTISPECIES: phage tail protein I [Chromohalobacter]MCI0508611.1 phage tail protein I [Chromohalobacter sp.]TDU23090.1 phage tail P2-like protein [Chromohalobacter marismortui]
MADHWTLLPPNASFLERAAAEAGTEIERVPVPLRDLWHPDRCPARLLPYLAWTFSVDRWDPTWSEAAKRAVIRSSFYVHRKKGTISALRRVVEPLGYLLEVTEWWQMEPLGERGTFALRIGVLDTGITDAMYTELTRLVDDAKPLTRHIAGLDLLGETRGPLYLGCAVYDGHTTTVYPYAAPATESTGLLYLGAALHVIDTTTVYPKPE